MTTSKRFDRYEWAMRLAEVSSLMSEDIYQKVGAVAIRSDYSVAGVSYNGAPPKIEIDWSNRDERRKYVIHAEMNLLRYIKPNECELVAITISPCNDCLKNLASYGIKKVLFREKYINSDFNEIDKISKSFGMELTHLPRPFERGSMDEVVSCFF